MDTAALRELYAHRELLDAWELYQSDLTAPAAEWHFWGSVIGSALQRWYHSRDAIAKALELPAEPELEAKIRHQAGYIFRLIGDLPVAIAHFDACLSLLANLPGLCPLLQGSCVYNKALTLEHYSRPREALLLYQQAEQEFARESMTTYRRMALQNAAWVYLDLCEADMALEVLEEAEPLCATPEDHWRQRMLRAYHARVADNRAKAVRLCVDIQEDGSVPEEVRCLTACIAADVALDLGLVDDARQMIRVAEGHMFGYPDSRCIAIVSRTFRRWQISKQVRSETGA